MVRRKYLDFIKRVTARINLDELVADGTVHDYETMKLALSKALKRKKEPTDKQVQLFLDYFGLVDERFEVPDVVVEKGIERKELKEIFEKGYKYTEVIRKGKLYVVVRDSKGRFVRWERVEHEQEGA